MGLPWVRLDTQFASNPKILELAGGRQWRAAFVFVCSLAYCGLHGSDGYIPSGALPFLHASKNDAKALEKVGLWEPDLGGWRVHDWAKFQQSDDESHTRREHYREMANRRWHPEWYE
jgi:hypothetical protein